tara:strand:+ start:342 stop:488 length:147 start_codon:yes stop_codon:yes gene_type:complete
MLGDGHTVVRHCEYAEDYEHLEPDAETKLCTFGDVTVQPEAEFANDHD